MTVHAGRDKETGTQARPPSRATFIRHLLLGFGLLVTILFTAGLCSLPR